MALLDWPGKSARPGAPEHPALYHMIDVGAVAERLVAEESLPEQDVAAVALLSALHDLGKISKSFRDMLRRGLPQTGGRHWEVTEVWLRDCDDLLADVLIGGKRARAEIYAAISGHHGRPPDKDVMGDSGKAIRRNAGAEAAADARAAISALRGLWPDAQLDLSDGSAKRRSWRLPGRIAAADWIGSDPHWFKPTDRPMALSDYLALARDRAGTACRSAGLGRARPKDGDAVGLPRPRPMQEAVRDAPLPDGPTLAVIEDETGSGKTEAGLMLAQRMLRAGKGRGLFVALPTMATADAMFSRLAPWIGSMFDGQPSLTLAHGRAGLSVPFHDLILRGTGEMEEGEASATTWLADDRRRALLADIGIGTIDQALMSVLPVRFATLRHHALASKLLLVDEVHEMGAPYMEEELDRLLEAHAMVGGSAILMTATLPLKMRARLVRAFARGRGDIIEDDNNRAYPALTVAGPNVWRRKNLPDATGRRGFVSVQRLASAAEAVDVLRDAATRGAACLWVRNAVDDVVAGCEVLRADGVQADMLHARFALCDRKRHEAAALERFGKQRIGGAGRVLVASQVVESSLDLDFDVMVTDLAPMAAMIQRAGRLWRHMNLRPAGTRAVAAPVLHVVSPDPGDVRDDGWLRQALDRGAWTYDLSTQWRSAASLFAAGEIVAPSGLRALIEPVHGDAPLAVPGAIVPAEIEAVGEGTAEAAHARSNLVELSRGYRTAGGGADDRTYPTRIGPEQTVLALARVGAAGLTPWAPDGWDASEVQVSARPIAGRLPDQSDPKVAAVKAGWPDWKAGAVTVCPVGEGGEIGSGVRYDLDQGLRIA